MFSQTFQITHTLFVRKDGDLKGGGGRKRDSPRSSNDCDPKVSSRKAYKTIKHNFRGLKRIKQGLILWVKES